MSVGGPQRQIGDHDKPRQPVYDPTFEPGAVTQLCKHCHQPLVDGACPDPIRVTTSDPGATHFVGDDCQPAHPPILDTAAPGWPDVDTLRSDSGWTHGTGDGCEPPHTAEEWHDMHRPEDAAAEWKRMYDGKVAELAVLQRTVEMQTALVTATAGVVEAAREIAATDFNNPFLPRYKAINAVIDALAALDKVATA